MKLEFMECATCAAKPGAPTLCHACLHNRDAIGSLTAEAALAKYNLKRSQDRLSTIRRVLVATELVADVTTEEKGDPYGYGVSPEYDQSVVLGGRLGEVVAPPGWGIARNGTAIEPGDAIRQGDKLRLVKKP